jgi:hypothetical protein
VYRNIRTFAIGLFSKKKSFGFGVFGILVSFKSLSKQILADFEIFQKFGENFRVEQENQAVTFVPRA